MTKMVIGLAAFAVALTSCNNSSQQTPGGMICPAGYNPIGQITAPGLKPLPIDAKANKSLPDDNQMKPGVYSYVAADIIYFETKKDRPAKIQLRDQGTAGQSTHQAVYCTENAGMKLEVPHTEEDVVTDVIVCSDYRQIVRSRHFAWQVVDGGITFSAPEMNWDHWCDDNAQTVYGKDAAIFVKDDDNNFEVRSHRDLPNGFFDLSSHMAYAPSPRDASGKYIDPPDCNKCPDPPVKPQPKPTP